MKIVNCTFNDNSSASGAAIVDAFGFGSTITNCVFWGDSGSAEIVDDYGGTTDTTVTYSDIQGGFSGAGNIDTDPMFIDAAGTIDFYDFQVVLTNFGLNSSAVTEVPSTDPIEAIATPAAQAAVLTGGADDTILGTRSGTLVLPTTWNLA